MSGERFSVWVWLPDDWHFPVAENVSAETAVKMAYRTTKAPGPASRVTIVNTEDDTTCFLWERGMGLVFPTPEQ